MKNFLQRFEEKYQPIPWTGCWLWTASTHRDGYGEMRNRKGEKDKAHRISYEMYKGKIPDELCVDHICRVRACVNPDHLRLLTPTQNTMAGFGYMANFARRTHCNYGHEFTPENTITQNGARRRCRTCKNEEGKRYKINLRKRGNGV